MKRLKISTITLFAGLLATLLSGCAPYKAQAPEGYAAWDQSSPYKAISADGVLFRVHSESDETKAGLQFWKEAVHTKLNDAGYLFQDSTAIKIGSGEDAWVLEYATPMGARDYTYTVALTVKGEDIVIAESGGELEDYKKDREKIIAALKKLKLE